MRRFIIVLIIIILGGFAFWFFFLKKESGTPSPLRESFQNFFSRETGGGIDQTNTENGIEPLIETPTLSEESRFSPLTPFPIAGYVVFDKTREVITQPENSSGKVVKETVVDRYVRFVSRTSGYVYETKNGGNPTQISNIYIPNIYSAVFTPRGDVATVRFLKEDGYTIGTYSIPIPEQNSDGTRTQKTGFPFPDNLSDIYLSKDGTSLVQIQKEGGRSIITVSDVKNTVKKELLQHPFESWLPFMVGNTVYLQTKASAFAGGFLYQVDTARKNLIKILGDIPGLTVSISPKGEYLLYSESRNGGFVSKIKNMKTKAENALSINVLPEKCIWLGSEDSICAGQSFLQEATYPDDWYAGVLSFNDSLYRVYSALGGYDVLDSGEEFSYDAINLSVDETRGVLYFIDKPTGILWQFDY